MFFKNLDPKKSFYVNSAYQLPKFFQMYLITQSFHPPVKPLVYPAFAEGEIEVFRVQVT